MSEVPDWVEIDGSVDENTVFIGSDPADYNREQRLGREDWTMPHAPASAPTKERAHELIDRMAPAQIPGVVGMLETMLAPLPPALANAPYDDEPITEDDLRDIAESRAARGQVFSNEQVLAEFGLTVADFERMAQTPLDSEEAGG